MKAQVQQAETKTVNSEEEANKQLKIVRANPFGKNPLKKKVNIIKTDENKVSKEEAEDLHPPQKNFLQPETEDVDFNLVNQDTNSAENLNSQEHTQPEPAECYKENLQHKQVENIDLPEVKSSSEPFEENIDNYEADKVQEDPVEDHAAEKELKIQVDLEQQNETWNLNEAQAIEEYNENKCQKVFD